MDLHASRGGAARAQRLIHDVLKSTRDSWKLSVFTLARLLAITSTLSCWASMPLAAVHNARIILCLLGNLAPFPGGMAERRASPKARVDGGARVAYRRATSPAACPECDHASEARWSS